MILTLDLATVTGYAAGAAGGEPTSGSVRIGRQGSAVGPFLAAYGEWLSDRIAEFKPQVLVYETPFIRRGEDGGLLTASHTAMKLMSLAGVTQMVAHLDGMRDPFEGAEKGDALRWDSARDRIYVGVDADTGCKFLTGRTRFKGDSPEERRAAKKFAVLERCRALGWQPADDNAGDALALWAFAEAKLFAAAHQRRGLVLNGGAAA